MAQHFNWISVNEQCHIIKSEQDNAYLSSLAKDKADDEARREAIQRDNGVSPPAKKSISYESLQVLPYNVFCHFIIILGVLVYNLLDDTFSHLGIKRNCVFILPYGQSSKGKWVSCGDRSQNISDSLHFIIFIKILTKYLSNVTI